MNSNIDEFIKRHCNKECFFTKIKKKCISLFRSSPKPTSTLESVAFQRKLQEHCKPYANRKKIYMFILSKQIYTACNRQKENKEGCISYLFDKLLEESKRFDIEQDSIVFQSVKLKFKELEELYRQSKYKELSDIVSDVLVDRNEIEKSDNYTKSQTTGAINNYIKKIVRHYQTEAFDPKSREAFVDNALLHIEDKEVKNYFEHKVFNYRKRRKQKKIPINPLLTIESELLLFLNQEEISYILSAVLYEFMHKEKFFSFINKRIPLRVIDFYRKNSTNFGESDYIEDGYFETDDTQDILEIYNSKIKLCSKAEQIILSLKFGATLTPNIEKALLLFKNDIYTIRLHLYNAGELTDKINNKIKRLQSIFFNEMRDKKGKILKGLKEEKVILTAKIVEKIYFATPLSYKEISQIFGQQPKWASKKKELLLKRLEEVEYDRL